jgi:transcriptional regulator of acetoin/glycerol metabolism
VPGAFTGATARRRSLGRLREAHGGTLFLDEIGDMPLALQTRLLRVLQERSVTPAGQRPPVPVDFALVCATHCNLREAAEQGRFRADLYYRINGLTVQPAGPARAHRLRRADPQRLLDGACTLGRTCRSCRSAAGALRAWRWPGNLRQYAACCARPAPCWTAWMTLDRLAPTCPTTSREALRMRCGRRTPGAPKPQNLHALSRAAIAQALEHSHGNVSPRPAQLGISRQTLYRKLAAGALH